VAILREEEFENFVKRRSAAMNGILIHGDDSAAVSAMGQQAVRAIVGSGDASFATVRLDSSALKDNPSRLDDEFRSLSLLGERRIILLDGAEDSHLKFLNSVIATNEIGNFIVLMTGALSKTSKLRAAIEATEKFASLALYEEDVAALAIRIKKILTIESLSWGEDAEDQFFATVGYDRSTSAQEARKLCLYCLGQTEISSADVEAVCGDTAAFGADELIDAVLAGDLEKADRHFSNLDSELGGSRTILQMLILHLTRLQNLRSDMERGLSADLAVRNAKPMIFFKRRNAVATQLRQFSVDMLVDLQQTLAAAIFQSRKSADLFDAITNRTLLSIARSVRSR
jgi:DNA polymerase III subunit delta